MKSYPRSERIEGHIQKIMAEMLIKEISDPRLFLVAITGVRLTPDMKLATVFFSVTGDEEREKQALAGFKSAHGFIKRTLAQGLGLKYMPDIRFEVDKAIKYGQKIDSILRNIKNNESDSSSS